jgi:thioredoxin reductase (NADPH)
MPKDNLDCLIVGGGPAGLTAAIYLARFHLSVRVVDAGDGRALSIPRTHNHPGFPGGISGSELIERMNGQVRGFNVPVDRGRVTRLDRVGHLFEAEWGEGVASARTVLIATGVRNRRPSIDQVLHDAALASGHLRYCPICDGYEITDKRVAVIGTADRGTNEAVFLRNFTSDVTLLAPDTAHELDEKQQRQLEQAAVRTVEGPSHVRAIDGDKIVIETAAGPLAFDTVYPALGSDINSSLAAGLGAAVSEVGCISVDSHQRTTVPGLYAAGDVVIGLDQISHAMGEGGVAATTIRNDLAAQSLILRKPPGR